MTQREREIERDGDFSVPGGISARQECPARASSSLAPSLWNIILMRLFKVSFFLSCSRSLALSIILSIFFSLCVSLRYNEEYE